MDTFHGLALKRNHFMNFSNCSLPLRFLPTILALEVHEGHQVRNFSSNVMLPKTPGKHGAAILSCRQTFVLFPKYHVMYPCILMRCDEHSKQVHVSSMSPPGSTCHLLVAAKQPETSQKCHAERVTPGRASIAVRLAIGLETWYHQDTGIIYCTHIYPL